MKLAQVWSGHLTYAASRSGSSRGSAVLFCMALIPSPARPRDHRDRCLDLLGFRAIADLFRCGPRLLRTWFTEALAIWALAAWL
jgi:hypothetical protein